MCNRIGTLASVFLFVACTALPAQTAPTKQDAPQPELVIDQIKKTVVFIQTSWPDSTLPQIPTAQNNQPRFKSMVGTGFLIFVEIPEWGRDASGNGRGVDFLVTAKHMIRQKMPDNQPGPYAKKLTIRFNTLNPVDASGRRWSSLDCDILDERGDLVWFVDDKDPIADVALTPVYLGDGAEFKTIPENSFATKSFIEEQHVNENDQIFFTGLFTEYFGAQKNYPVVRHGRLALLPGEDVAIDPSKPDKKSQIYLAEVTSFGGNSGSPVFLRLGALREGLQVDLRVGYTYRLLGVMRGFVSDEEAKQNTGIALVVPAEKIVEILSSDFVKAYIARAIAHDMATKGDLKTAEAKFQESISLLEKRAPEGSQLVATLRDFAVMLHQMNRSEDALKVFAKAQRIAAHPVSKIPEP